VTEIEQDLRAASDRLLQTLDQLEELEIKKRSLEPNSAEFGQLSAEIERLAAAVFAHTHAQRTLGEKTEVIAKRTGADVQPIDETAPTRELSVILAEWRAAERRLGEFQPDSAEHGKAKAELERLRAEYHAAYAAAHGTDDKSKR
jgi:hypothetical protein